jgi:hypothetical protein
MVITKLGNWSIFFEDIIICEHQCQQVLYSSISFLNENNYAYS